MAVFIVILLKTKKQKQKQKSETKTMQEDKVMKTINNVQKTIAKSAIATAVLLFVCFALNAQHPDFEMVAMNKPGKNKAVLVTNKLSDDYVVIGLRAYSKAWLSEFMKAESDKQLRIERWMFLDVAGKAARSERPATEATQTDQSASTELTMLSDLSIFQEEAHDEELHLEDWMFRSIKE
jgi:hypothetical protein